MPDEPVTAQTASVGAVPLAAALHSPGTNGQYPHTDDTPPIRSFDELDPDVQCQYLLDIDDIEEWWTPRCLNMLGRCRPILYLWMRLKVHARKFGIKGAELEASVDAWIGAQTPEAPQEPDPAPRTRSQARMPFVDTHAWRNDLVYTLHGEPKQTAANISLLLEHHPYWQDRLWFDLIRGRAMQDDTALSDDHITEVMRWLQVAERLPTTMHKLVERCVVATCHKHPRDLLQTLLLALPPWDETPRLDTWLMQIGGVIDKPYSRVVSRLLPVSMVARVMDPGCLYRFVVILEGPEEYRKSTLVQALAGQDWYIPLAIGLETKESHMMLQGAWVAEMPELDSLSRTEETRLKAFITMREDAYIPKYSNFRVQTPRRTIFIGTTNEETYLKGQTGNTRFLPLTLTRPVDVETFVAMREQLLAEALHHYWQHPTDWWMFPEEVMDAAREMREARRIPNVFEDSLGAWLAIDRFHLPTAGEGMGYFPTPDVTTWQEIAQYYLKIEKPERWKDMLLQRQIGAALRALGWTQKVEWCTETKTSVRLWRKDGAVKS
jgi:predicted P-loop ATPase